MKKSRSRKEYTETNLWQKIKPRRARVTAQQNNIVAINLTLLIIPKTGAQTFDVKPNRVVNVSRRGTERGKSGSEKALRIRRTVTSKKRGGWPPRTLYRATTGRGLDDPGQAGIHPTFSPTPRVPRIRSLPPRFDTVLKVVLPPSFYLPVVVPSLPTTSVTIEEDSLPPSPKGCPDTPPMRITELIRRMRYIIASVFRSVEWSSGLYKFLTHTAR